jgi:hypothetical protein
MIRTIRRHGLRLRSQRTGHHHRRRERQYNA